MSQLRRLPMLAALLLLSATPLRAQAADPSGHWEGSIQIPGMELGFAVDLAKNDTGGLAGTISIPTDNLKGLPLSNVAVDGTSVRFVLRVTSGGGPFEGTLSPDGSSISGVFATHGFSIPFSMIWAGDAWTEPPAKSPAIPKELEGTWNGTLDTSGKPSPLFLKMSNQPDGTATGTLIGGGLELPITMTQQGARLMFEVKAVGGSYSGVLSAEGTELVGTYTEGSLTRPLRFRRTAATGATK